MKLKILTDKGKIVLNKLLNDMKNGAIVDVPDDLLEEYTVEAYDKIDIQIEVDPSRKFKNRFELGKYLYELFRNIDRKLLFNEPGLWNWLTYLWLDQLCPFSGETRKVGELARYIYDSRYTKYYRHLILSSWDIYSLHGKNSKIMLYSPVYQTNDILEQLASRQNIITNKGLIETVYKLYWDNENNRPVTGASDRNRPGNVRRLVSVAEQLDLTYDLHTMPSDDIINLLPNEFDSLIDLK